ncbi:efflux transporter outer membrane subunit [Pontibacter sp. BT310]|uniref:Efflux transporter outer membrane subunit n=1 Tax=Pontibacter populi TaxID=890055 RepID=A0ABS6XF60_9BACT|nr:MULTISPECIES: efflux transporter outer membrane subunit [Pontibacter]MBJ6119299.1 efflux transporter outer membrane subunit [Pontibacter sp. BT310]MBR0571727.1 efflux transporter outer membrane subunit [Microvirga sp. STS03]MBW3366153.1 efflux transporter outer membrane subunit [Pontibacter populi]
MYKRNLSKWVGVAFVSLSFTACSVPALVQKSASPEVPASYNNSQDTTNTASTKWQEYFADPNLKALINTALQNNQELNITLQEIQIAQNEVRARKGEYLPTVGLKAGTGLDKVARYTNIGAMEANTNIDREKEMPEPLPDFLVGAYAKWEVDVWHKLRNAKKSAVMRYLSSVEGKNFMVTNLVAEVANSYYELLALDNQLDIVKQNIELQTNVLGIVKAQKEAARVNELAVRRFEAQVLSTKSLQYSIQQRITEMENKINFLIGRYPQPVTRSAQTFNDLVPVTIQAGIPAQLLENRPDIKQAELDLAAAKLDVQVAKANFYPSLGITAGIGIQAFDPSYLLKTPESLLYSIAGDLTAPLINKNAIKATYYSANAKQLQSVYNYERTVLNAYIEVANQLSNISNLEKSYSLKAQQVQALTQSVSISNELFKSARADYMEVLLTQREALESRFELIETKMQQLSAHVAMYQALGGGWN